MSDDPLPERTRREMTRLRLDVNELRRQREEDRRAMAFDRARPGATAIEAKATGLARPGERQLHRPNFTAAATAGVRDTETARAALAVLREMRDAQD